MKNYFCLLIGCFLAVYGQGQGLFKRKFEPKQAVLVDLVVKRQTPGADMAKRFGTSYSLGMELSYKSTGNWLFGIGGHFMFGKNVKETGVLDSLKGKTTGEVIDQNGQFAVVGMDQRGMFLGASIGKLIPLNHNRNSGIFVTIGGGYLQHRIRIYTSNTVPQLSDEYKKGYDRLTFGPAATQYLGYRFLDPRKRVNFTFGVEIIEGFTQNRRSLNFDTGVADRSKRLDVLTGLKFTLSIPLYLKKKDEEEFFE